MKIITQRQSVNPSNELLLCVDVSKESLSLFSKLAVPSGSKTKFPTARTP